MMCSNFFNYFPFILSFRIFWIILVIVSLLFSLLISLNEWDKFRNNPTALFIETDYRRLFFDKPGLTICADNTNETLINDILMKNFSLTVPTDPKFQYYFEYLKVIANTNYSNLNNYIPFVNDTRIKKEDFVKIASEIKNNSANPLKGHFRLVVTELGACFTSSRIDIVMDPYKGYYT